MMIGTTETFELIVLALVGIAAAYTFFLACRDFSSAVLMAMENRILRSTKWKRAEKEIRRECLKTLVFQENIDPRGKITAWRSPSNKLLLTSSQTREWLGEEITISPASHNLLQERTTSILARHMNRREFWVLSKSYPHLRIPIGNFSSSHQVMDAVMAP